MAQGDLGERGVLADENNVHKGRSNEFGKPSAPGSLAPSRRNLTSSNLSSILIVSLIFAIRSWWSGLSGMIIASQSRTRARSTVQTKRPYRCSYVQRTFANHLALLPLSIYARTNTRASIKGLLFLSFWGQWGCVQLCWVTVLPPACHNKLSRPNTLEESSAFLSITQNNHIEEL